MNRFGEMLMEFSRGQRPKAFAEVEDPEAFFGARGREVAAEVEAVARQVRATPSNSPWTEDQARAAAEEIVLSEHWLLVPEDDVEEDDLTRSDDPELARYYRSLAEIAEVTRLDW